MTNLNVPLNRPQSYGLIFNNQSNLRQTLIFMFFFIYQHFSRFPSSLFYTNRISHIPPQKMTNLKERFF